MSQESFTQVPELSLKAFTHGTAQEKSHFTEQLFAGLKYYGFIILKDHPVSEELLHKAYELSESFFNLPEETKNKYYLKDAGGTRGYTPFGTEHAKGADVKDLKEFWHVGNECFRDNVWPEELPEFKPTFLQLFNSLESVGKTMLRSLTKPLELPEDYFDKMVDGGTHILRLLHYPPIPEDVDPRCVRAAAHEDINLITVLVAASTSGLELLDRNNEWLAVETDANNLVVDAGDMLMRLTNDVIPSTTHRVVNPDDGNREKSRYSMPFFIHPNKEAMLTCIDSCRGEGAKYDDINSYDFLLQRLRENGMM